MKTIKIEENTKYLAAQKYLIAELKSYITSDVNTLTTNGNLATCLQDCAGYNLENLEVPKLEAGEDGKAKQYKLGSLEGLQIIVDPYMLWTDNRIILKNDETIVEEIKVIDETDSLL